MISEAVIIHHLKFTTLSFESLTDVPTLNLLLPSVDPDSALYEAARLVRTSRPAPRDVWGKWTA
jgi:hypothetical protein